MRLTKGEENLGLPSWMKFGVELEVENLSNSKIKQPLKNIGWRTIQDASLIDNGTECVSPVLHESENEQVWENIGKVCKIIDENPSDSTRESYGGKTCGFHVHFDATELLKNKEMMKNFLRLYAESEEYIYRMANPKGEALRASAISIESPKIGSFGLRNLYNYLNTQLYRLLNGNKGFAFPISKKIQKQLQNGKLKLGRLPKCSFTRSIIADLKLSFARYSGLNLANLGSKNKNTVEFRMANGTKSPEIVKQTVFLYASLLNTAYKMTYYPEQVKDKLTLYYQKGLLESDRLETFLNLIIDEEDDRQVYRERYKATFDRSIEGMDIFEKNKEKFSCQRFTQEDYRDISQGIPTQIKAKALKALIILRQKAKGIIANERGELEFGRE